MPPFEATKLAFVPPRVKLNWPAQPSVNEVAANNATVGLPPNVNVTLVSSTLVKADGVIIVPMGFFHVASPHQKVFAAAPVPLSKFVTGKFPITPVVKGRPVQLVKIPEAGVPK